MLGSEATSLDAVVGREGDVPGPKPKQPNSVLYLTSRDYLEKITVAGDGDDNGDDGDVIMVFSFDW